MLRRISVLALLACSPGAAQQPSPVIPQDPFGCFTMSGAPASNLTVVNVEGQPFSRAWHIRSYNSANAWDIRIRCFQTAPARKGDTILAAFWMRTANSATGAGYTTFVVEKGKEPWTKSAQWTTSAGAAWKKVEVPFSMLEDYNAGEWNVSFWVTFDPQEIEIGGLTMLNYGQNFPIRDLPLTAWPYEGHEADAPWRAAAAGRIEKIRKADIAVVVKDNAGKPVENARVHLRMKRHAFGFGTAVAGRALMEPSANREKYREELLRNFNKAVIENDLKWPFWETWGKTYAIPSLDWLRQNGITDIRGHNLIWPGAGNLPPDVVQMLKPPVDQDALRARIYNHIAEIMAATKGRLTEWDVLNEPYTNKDVQAVLGEPEMAEWFKKAREADPAPKLFINDYNIVAAGGYDLPHQNGLYRIIQLILDHGGPIDGIGVQSHFNSNLTPPARVLEVLDRFAQFGKEIEVTEFDINIGDEQLQADYTRDFLTVTFSHPAVKSFLMWGFWAGAHWLPGGAMFRQDWTPKPNLDAWRDLVYRQWWTDVEGVTDGGGVYRARGFLGDYEVDVTAGGVTQTFPLTVAGGQPNYVLAGTQTRGAVTAAGVVNAASFAGGPVAPGEIVAIWGSGFGPAEIRHAAYDGVQLNTLAGDTRVLFDGVPAPMIYSLSGQVSAIVPYSVSGSTKVEIEYLGVKTNAAELPVASAAPGIFCYAGGKGQAVAVNYLNGDVSFNSDRPVARGGFISFYVTGEGQTTPAGIDGRLPVYPANPRPSQPVTVTIGGVESKCPDNWIGVVYAGVTQVNACVPQGVPSGDVPLVVSVGGVHSQPGVTVRVE